MKGYFKVFLSLIKLTTFQFTTDALSICHRKSLLLHLLFLVQNLHKFFFPFIQSFKPFGNIHLKQIWKWAHGCYITIIDMKTISPSLETDYFSAFVLYALVNVVFTLRVCAFLIICILPYPQCLDYHSGTDLGR